MDILERLGGYNPPDRVNIEQRQIAVDILDAKDEIERLREALKEILEIGEHIVFPVADMTNIARSALQAKDSE